MVAALRPGLRKDDLPTLKAARFSARVRRCAETWEPSAACCAILSPYLAPRDGIMFVESGSALRLKLRSLLSEKLILIEGIRA